MFVLTHVLLCSARPLPQCSCAEGPCAGRHPPVTTTFVPHHHSTPRSSHHVHEAHFQTAPHAGASVLDPSIHQLLDETDEGSPRTPHEGLRRPAKPQPPATFSPAAAAAARRKPPVPVATREVAAAAVRALRGSTPARRALDDLPASLPSGTAGVDDIAAGKGVQHGRAAGGSGDRLEAGAASGGNAAAGVPALVPISLCRSRWRRRAWQHHRE